MLIFIIGFMGAGKTTAGRKIAAKMGYSFMDLDEFISHKTGKTIPQIFESEGEEGFRLLEKNALRALNVKKCIIATGGGTPCFHDNMEWMNKNGVTVCLSISPKSACNRLKASTADRPLLKGKTDDELLHDIESLMKQREGFYAMARIIAKAENLDITGLCFQIAEEIDKR